MRSQWKRLGIAALLSCSCAAATILWYKSTEKKNGGSNETPLAQVSRVGDEVLRRPSTRLLWQSVNTGDNLYNGETIRTSNRGELRIQFEDGRYIDLEPDSLIVLQKSKGEISLDLMEGSLFVNAQAQAGQDPKAAAAPGLVLNSKSGKVDLTGSSASLSKGSSGQLDLQVLEGKATVQGADGKAKEVTSGKASSLGSLGGFDNSNLKIIAPVQGKVLFIDPEAEKPVLFRWSGFPSQWKVGVMAGSTKKDMHEVATTENAGENSVAAKIPLGKFWYRLVARDPATQKIMAESSNYRVDLQARYAPTVVFPMADAEIPVEKSPFDLTFKWQRTEETSRVQIEVATDERLKRLISNKAFGKEEQFTLPGLKDGTYFWRMTSTFDDGSKPMVGKVQRFRILKLAAVQKEPVQIVWSIPEDKSIQTFVVKPQLELSWEPKNRQDEVASYRLVLRDEQNPSAEAQSFTAKAKQMKAPIPKAGRYMASVEALDKEGNTIGKSDVRTLAANELPLVGAPTITPATGNLQSGFDGRTELRWGSIQGAKEYWLTVKDKNGKELAKKKYDTNMANLKNLMPGEYNLTLQAVDVHGRPGTEAPVRTLIVPDKSNLKAPTLKKIKVN